MTTLSLTSKEQDLRASHRTRTVRVALFGFGVVGTGVWKILQSKKQEFLHRFGANLEVAGICVRDRDRRRPVSIEKHLLTDDLDKLLNDGSIDVVLELIGGRFEALGVIEAALEARKHVITANKLVLAHELPRLEARAHRQGVNLFYSASVCGSIPILRTLDEIKVGDTIQSFQGIVNGSTNFILTAMHERGLTYDEAIVEARLKGFLEADPTLDVSGADAAQKLSVLIYHAFGEHLTPSEIETVGIDRIDSAEISKAKLEGKVIKLIASAKRTATGIQAQVGPQLMDREHLFANTRDEFNAIEIDCLHAGPQILYGKGAGSLPTASAVISDLIELMREQ